MRKYVLAICTAALFALPTSVAFSQVDVEVGPGGFHVGPGYHRPTIIAMKVVVVAAENYEQLVCTRKN